MAPPGSVKGVQGGKETRKKAGARPAGSSTGRPTGARRCEPQEERMMPLLSPVMSDASSCESCGTAASPPYGDKQLSAATTSLRPGEALCWAWKIRVVAPWWRHREAHRSQRPVSEPHQEEGEAASPQLETRSGNISRVSVCRGARSLPPESTLKQEARIARMRNASWSLRRRAERGRP